MRVKVKLRFESKVSWEFCLQLLERARCMLLKGALGNGLNNGLGGLDAGP